MNCARGVLVTGANGFIGRAVIRRLESMTGMSAVGAVRGTAGQPVDRYSSRTAPDLGPAADWRRALAGVDIVIHLAARVHVMQERARDALGEFRRVNVEGTVRLAEQAAELGVRRFVFVSSIKVNGESTAPGRAFTEADVPQPTDPYGISKAEAEAALLAAPHATMDVCVVRPPLVYGPGVKANFLSMARWLKRGIPLPLGALRDNRRSLVALDNLVDLLVTAAAHPAAAGEIFLAADGEDLSTTELLRRTAAALGVRSRLVPVPPILLEIAARSLGRAALWQRLAGNLQVDAGKARRVLGWRPVVSVDEALRRAVADLP